MSFMKTQAAGAARRMVGLLFPCWCAIGAAFSLPASAASADLCVYGATPGGIAAAVSAAKAGLDVTLADPTSRIGGLMTSGLSYSDFRSFEALSGFFWEFSRRVQQHYSDTYGADSAQAQGCWRGTIAEPKVNLQIFEQMLAEQNVRVLKQHAILRVETTPWQNGRRRLAAAVFRDASGAEVRIEARIFIDASYEGDLMALAGENYHVGRESRRQYGEPMAGDAQGSGDGQVQGYNFRFVMTQVEANKRMPAAPAGYRREDFVGVLQHFASGKLKKVFSPGHDGIYRAHLPLLPNGKADINDTPHAPVRLSMPDINDGYPDGDADTRRAIVQQHLDYNVGLLYFLQNDPEVPEAIRADACAWGWCRDEFVETGGLPPQLYIREARRMVGQHVFTGNDTELAKMGQAPSVRDSEPVPFSDARSVLQPDSIAMGDYVHNCHGTGRTGTRFDGRHHGEFYKPVSPYQIPYGVIVPQKTENLLVPVACSASHFGFSALRLEPIWSNLGQAAGWAAALAVADGVPVQSVEVRRLQARLHADRLATIYVSDVAPDSPNFAAVQWFGTRGGLHGLADNQQPRPRSLGGQYSAAHPGHEAGLDRTLDQTLRARWHQLTPLPDPSQSTTRLDWITAAYLAHGTR
jgi:hypothetical protein